MKTLIFVLSILFSCQVYAAGCDVLLSAKTAADDSLPMILDKNKGYTATFYVTPIGNLTSGEDSHIEFSIDEGSTWEDLKKDNAQVILDEQNNAYTITGSGRYRVHKDSTTGGGAVGVRGCQGEGF